VVVPSVRDVFPVYRGRLGTMLALSALWLTAAVLEIAALGALYAVAAAAVGPGAEGAGAASLVWQYLERANPGVHPVLTALILYAVIDTTYLVVFFCQRAVTQAIALRIRAAYNQRLFDTYLHADYQFLLNRRHGEVMYRALAAPVQIGEMAVAPPQMIAQGTMLAGVLALMLLISAQMTGILLLLSLLLFAAYEVIARLWIFDFGRTKVSIRQRQSILVAEALDGIKQFKVYGRLERWSDAFRRAADDFALMSRRLFAVTTVPPHALGVVSVGTFVVGGLAVLALMPERVGEFLPLITMYFVALQRLLPSVAGAAQARGQLVQNLPALRMVEDELAAPSQLIQRGTEAVRPLQEGITFRHVGLTYPDRPPVLHDVSFALPAGHVTAIVGPSGSGKSSLLNLIVRLFDPTSGVIHVDGRRLDSLDTRAWREHIGLVSQESFLFHGTVTENIAFGRQVTDAQVRAAARLSLADEFIDGLPDGYDTIVGEQGMKLSGGQRQRIGIARAILLSPPIVIFDEATNALDGPSEAAVQRSISQVSEGRTVVMVAHRLASVRHAGTILVLEAGTVVESGTHEALLAADGLYATLYRQDGPAGA